MRFPANTGSAAREEISPFAVIESKTKTTACSASDGFFVCMKDWMLFYNRDSQNITEGLRGSFAQTAA